MLELGHVLFDRSLLGEGPGQHELGFEYGTGSSDDSVESCRHPGNCRVLHVALDISDCPAGIALVPAAVEVLGYFPELHDQIAR
jgi:hypothetical protein